MGMPSRMITARSIRCSCRKRSSLTWIGGGTSLIASTAAISFPVPFAEDEHACTRRNHLANRFEPRLQAWACAHESLEAVRLVLLLLLPVFAFEVRDVDAAFQEHAKFIGLDWFVDDVVTPASMAHKAGLFALAADDHFIL